MALALPVAARPPIARIFLALSLAIFSGCVEADLCARAPICEDNRALNCDYTCAGCSGTPDLRECGAAQCEIAPGDPSTVQFFRARAVCVVSGSGQCDPAASAPPTCADGVIRGCSAFRRVIEADCARADRYFTDTTCCAAFDGGTGSDGGSPGDGGTDAGP